MNRTISHLPAPFSLSRRDDSASDIEKCANPLSSLNGTVGNATDRFIERSSEQPTHHLISDEDLQSLLSVALSFATEELETQRAARPSDILLDFGKKLYDPPPSSVTTGPAFLKRKCLRELSRVVKRIYGMRVHAHSKDTGPYVPIDPESLVPITVDIGECDDYQSSMDV